MTWFNKQSKVVQVILLLIPFVNWVIEVIVRWSTFSKKGGLVRLIVCLVVTIGGTIIGWLDAIWVLIFNRLVLQ